MMRLRPFELKHPASLADAAASLRRLGGRARLLGGGTDLLPNLKLAQVDAEVLVSLRDVPDLTLIERDGDALVIGARARLAAIAADPLVREHAPALAGAIGRIASPPIRNMGTLGGNLCQDTRCRYINQSELFREALGGCLKSHGDVCHVVPGGSGCVAAICSDAAPVLIAMDATADVVGPDGERRIPVDDLYTSDGLRNLSIAPDELIARVRVPIPASSTRIAYRKWAVRRSIDFPLVSVAVRFDLDGTTLTGGCVVAGVLGAKPKRVALGRLAGRALDDALAAEVGALTHKRCRPLENVPYDADYRRERLAVEAERAAASLLRETP